jgi:transposase
MSVIKYKQKGQIGLFDKEETSIKLSRLGNPLKKIRLSIDFESFRSELEATILNQKKKSKAGCRPYDVVMMFKIILLKNFYQLNDKQTEYQINDRLSFKEFLGLSSGDRVPNFHTIRIFQHKLRQNNVEERLIEQFHGYLREVGLSITEGKITDANCVKIPRQGTENSEK